MSAKGGVKANLLRRGKEKVGNILLANCFHKSQNTLIIIKLLETQ